MEWAWVAFAAWVACSQLCCSQRTDADDQENERSQSGIEDIDESSAQGLCDAESYAKANAMLIQAPMLGTTKIFWRLSDEATRISRNLALILRAHHSAGKYITSPLQVSNVWISRFGNVKLRRVSFTDKDFSIMRVRDDYKQLSRVLWALICISGGDATKLPPDYIEFLKILRSDTLAMKDELFIVNNSALLPMKNCTEDIDESSAQGLCDAKSYAMANAMLIKVPVLGTMKTFWRLSDKATRISRKLALILRAHHSVGKYITNSLQVSNVWISNSGSVKLREVSFTGKGFSIMRVRDDYKQLSRVLWALIQISGGDITKLPPDYKEFLTLLGSDTLAMKDEFLIVNNSALLPMKNRTEVFLMLYDRIQYLGRMGVSQEEKNKKRTILSNLPYEKDWLNTARANSKINQWVLNVQNHYDMTQFDQLRLNRNVRSHLHQYNGGNIEEILYCEWPELLMAMEKMLDMEGELEGTDIQNKFG